MKPASCGFRKSTYGQRHKHHPIYQKGEPMEDNTYTPVVIEGVPVYPTELYRLLAIALTAIGVEDINNGTVHSDEPVNHAWQVTLQGVMAKLGSRSSHLAYTSAQDMVNTLINLRMAIPEPGTGYVHLFFPTAEAIAELDALGAVEAAIYTEAADVYVAVLAEYGFMPRYKSA